MAVEEHLLLLRRVGFHEGGTRVAQPHQEQLCRDRFAGAGDDDLALAKIHLRRLARLVVQHDVHLVAGLPP